jgi:type IV pilus assembly protein PilA
MGTLSVPRSARALRQAINQRKSRSELEGDAEAGFTLIELMVVLLIMAILLAIAIPTFLGVKSGAQDRAVQSNLTNALTSAKAGYANGGSYQTAATAETSALASAEPNIAFETGTASTGSNNLAVNVAADGQELLLVGYSQSGTCWAAIDNEGTLSADNLVSGLGSGVWYNNWTQGTGTPCSTTQAAAEASGTWRTHY